MSKVRPLDRFALDGDIRRAREAFPPGGCGPRAHGPHRLTNTELYVLKMIGLGMTNNEIAAHLGITLLTARCHIKRIHEKCDIKGRPRLAVTANTIWQSEEMRP